MKFKTKQVCTSECGVKLKKIKANEKEKVVN